MRGAIQILIVLAIMTMASGCAMPGPGERDGVFIHISSGARDPQRVLVGLNVAVSMAGNKDVIVYFDAKGIEAALKDSENLSYAQFSFSHDQIKKLAEKGVGLYACPDSLKAAGKTREDLLPGVKLADKELFFKFTTGRILTMDY